MGKSWLDGFLFSVSYCLTYVLSLILNRSIFKLAVWSFTGFASLFPIVIAALFLEAQHQIRCLRFYY